MADSLWTMRAPRFGGTGAPQAPYAKRRRAILARSTEAVIGRQRRVDDAASKRIFPIGAAIEQPKHDDALGLNHESHRDAALKPNDTQPGPNVVTTRPAFRRVIKTLAERPHRST